MNGNSRWLKANNLTREPKQLRILPERARSRGNTKYRFYEKVVVEASRQIGPRNLKVDRLPPWPIIFSEK